MARLASGSNLELSKNCVMGMTCRTSANALFMQIPGVILAAALRRGPNSRDAFVRMCQSAWVRRSQGHLGLAHPGFLGKPVMRGATNRAVNAREKDRSGVEPFTIGNDAGWDIVSRLWAFDHDDAH